MTFHASCHCGAVRVDSARRPGTLTECNCAICSRYGARWAYFTSPSVRIRANAGTLATYKEGYRTFVYYFCRRCGCVTHYRRVNTTNDDRIAVNARMMNPADVASIPIRKLNVKMKNRR